MSSHKKKVAMIGCGMVAKAYVESFAELSDRMVLSGALASTPGSASNFLDKNRSVLPEAKAYADIDALVADRPDMAVLITPPNMREDYVKALASANIPILMEKPIERNLENAANLVSVCEDRNVPLGIVLQHRVRPSAKKLRDLLDEKDFGPLRLVEISVPWWRPQAYYNEPGRGTYERDGGGVLISQAIHTLDLALQFTGPVATVQAMCRTSAFHDMEAEDFVTAGLTFESGAFGSLMATTSAYPGRTEEIILHHTRASVTFRSAELVVAWQDGKTETFGTAQASGAGADPMAFTSDWHRAIIADFLDCIDSGARPVADGRSALAVHALIEAITASGADGCVTTIKKETGS